LETFLKELKEPDEYPGYLLWQASNISQRFIKNIIKQFNATYTQFIILISILYLSTQINQRQIARHVKLDKMTTSDAVRTLEVKKFLIRYINPDDKRHDSKKVTKKGIELVFNIFYHVRKCDTKFFKTLGEEAKIFSQLLVKVIKGNYDNIYKE
jgi:MarR family transcriptional regulator, organic hydroperoxide resistance regulator